MQMQQIIAATSQPRDSIGTKMIIITDTSQHFTAAFMHYVCIRMQFRSTVLKEATVAAALDKRYAEYCPAKH